MSSELDPDAGRDDPSPNAPKSADLNDETSSGPKETSGQADEHQAKAAESQLPVARLLNEAGQRLDDGTPPEPASMSDRPDRTGTVESLNLPGSGSSIPWIRRGRAYRCIGILRVEQYPSRNLDAAVKQRGSKVRS